MNVLFIMTDSLPPQLCSVWGGLPGSAPNIDRLAGNGVVFERAYCNCPLCAPARASLVTGRYVSQIGAFDNASEFSSEWPTIGHAMQASGREAVVIGKMHLVGHDQNHGFTRVASHADYTTGYNPHDYAIAYNWEDPPHPNPFGVDWMAPSYVKNEKWDHYPRHYDWDEEIHRAALSYLGERGPQSDPFFCCVSYHAPHNPFWIPEPYKSMFRGADLPIPRIPAGIETVHGPMDEWLNTFHHLDGCRERLMEEDNLRWLYETFYGMLADLDRKVGELLSVLSERGLAGNTAIVFAGDHGDMLGHRGMVQKRYLYEMSVRAPLIFSFPGRWAEGARISTPVSLVDVFPTFAEMVGAPVPDDLPGISLLPCMEEAKEPPDRTIFCEYHGEGVHAPCFMAVRGDHKYVYVHGFEERLYDLSSDPDEFRNRLPGPAYSSVASDLRQQVPRQFDPDRIAQSALQSQRNRRFVFGCVR